MGIRSVLGISGWTGVVLGVTIPILPMGKYVSANNSPRPYSGEGQGGIVLGQVLRSGCGASIPSSPVWRHRDARVGTQDHLSPEPDEMTRFNVVLGIGSSRRRNLFSGRRLPNYMPQTPPVSPWMGLWQRNTGPLDNYHSYVLPQMQLNSAMQMQNAALGSRQRGCKIWARR